MAYDDYHPGYPSSWDDEFSSIVDQLADDTHNRDFLGDAHALDLIDHAFFDMDISRGERDLARAEAAFYFDDMYDIDIFDVWDYDDYRDWYDAA